MENNKITSLIESVIIDLTNNESISKILLKTQTIAFYLKDKEFSSWLEKEQLGYNNKKELPDYRILPCLVRALLLNNGSKMSHEVPVDSLDVELDTRAFLSELTLGQSLTRLEDLLKNNPEKECQIPLPYIFYPIVNKIFPTSNVENLYQYTPNSVVKSILDKVKSKLLQFFLELNEKIEASVNFGVLAQNKEIQKTMNQTIYAGVVNTGEGNVEVRDSSIVGGQGNKVKILADDKKKILEIITQIEKLSSEVDEDRTDIAESILDIRNELNETIHTPKILKKALNAIKGVVGAGEIFTLAQQAINLLPEQ